MMNVLFMNKYALTYNNNDIIIIIISIILTISTHAQHEYATHM